MIVWLEMELNQIICADAEYGLMDLPRDCCDICVTSPVYKNSDGFDIRKLEGVFREVFRVLKDDSLFMLNFGHLKEDKFRPFRVCQIAMDCGFQLADTIVWRKNHFTPLNGKKNLNNLSEFIFMLYKSEMPDLDRLSIGVPYEDASNAKRYAGGRNLRCRGNIWDINIPTITKSSQRAHKDEYPQELPELCIKLSGIPDGAVVLDPFSGGGTTLLAAKKLNKQFIGFEINKSHWEIGNKRLLDFQETKDIKDS